MRSFTREEIKTIVESIGLPCAYYQFQDNTPQTPPFICWFFSEPNDLMADDQNYVDIEMLNVELYTKYRDFDQEKAVEAVLTANGLAFKPEINFVESEKIWQIAYESEVIINVTEE